MGKIQALRDDEICARITLIIATRRYLKRPEIRKNERFLDKKDAKSTGNLHKHAVRCWGEKTVKAANSTANAASAREALASTKSLDVSITALFKRAAKATVTYSHRQHTTAEARAEFVRWVCESKRPFQIVNDRAFRSLMKTGRPGYTIPSAETLSRDVKKVFTNVRQRIAKMMQEYEGQLNFATDAWTSPNNHAFVAFTVHFEHEGEPISMLLDIVELAKSHSGKNLADTFKKVLADFGVEDKLLGVTCDNASNMDTMIEVLEELLPEFPGASNQTRCFAHILNLVAKSILRQFDTKKKATVANEDPIDALARELDDAMGTLLDDDQPEDDSEDDEDGLGNERAGMSAAEIAELEESLGPVRALLTKLRAFSNAVKRSSTLLLPAWLAMLKKLALRVRNMPRDVLTRWNSTFEMLEFAITYRGAIDAMTSERSLNLRKYELDDNEWLIATKLRDTLKIFKHATLFFSRGNTPSLSKVIPAMDHIDATLATTMDDMTVPPSIRAAVAIGKRTLNKYYNKTDHTEVYQIAMVLDPQHKLEYFTKAGWEQEWINAARNIVRDEYDRTYALREVDDPVEISKPNVFASSDDANIFDNLPVLTAPAPESDAKDELNAYLAEKTEKVKDLCRWWYERRSTYPRLYRMALDYHTIPATSVDVERVFSEGRIILSHLRSRLSVQSTRALMCVGVWSKLGYVKDSDITKVVNQTPPLKDDEKEAFLTPDWDAILV
ncbi:hypothetical protein D9619_011280 [Psilocybe cf. subviscida]|uniref:HAT C-terminal dimerisation domain-containing protein n=1 Tax=Psilocybe cf. subviscida TaxID=2480587 RepID=A0A8H5BIY7_9AGAR|nr:hypothetical protein D9619_011280 [Psilocybe cf. subviscida]